MLDVPPGSAGRPMPGYDIRVLAPDGSEVGADEMGDICVKLPLPPGCFPTLWQNDARFRSSYLDEFPGYYRSGDAGYFRRRRQRGSGDEPRRRHHQRRRAPAVHRHDGGGHRRPRRRRGGRGGGAADADKGRKLPVAMVVLKSGVTRPSDEVIAELVALVRDRIGPVAAFRHATLSRSVSPATRSGKVVRATLRQIADGKEWNTPATIDDPAILTEIEAQLATIGYPRRGG